MKIEKDLFGFSPFSIQQTVDLKTASSSHCIQNCLSNYEFVNFI